jgi:probable F420-dependent oxidoreductase
MHSADADVGQRLGTFGVWSYLDHLSVGQIMDWAHLVDELGYDCLWLNESVGREPFALLGRLTRETRRITLGLGIASVYSRDAYAARAAASTIQELSDGRFVMGLGLAHRASVTDLRGHEYGPAVATMSRYLDAYEGAEYRGPPPPAEPPLVVAALRRRMLELAATRSTGPFAYFVTVDYVRWARAVVDAAAESAGRSGRPLLVVSQAAVLSSDPTEARKAGRVYAGRHLAQPNYVRNLLEHGFTEDDVAGEGSDRLIDGLVAWGDRDTIRERIEQMRHAGADHVALIPISTEGAAADHACARALAPR